MKTLILTLAILYSLNIMASEEYTCEGSRCSKKTVVIVPDIDTELKLSELQEGQCLMDIKKGKTLRLLSVNQNTGMIVTIIEDDYMLTREVHFYSGNSIDRSMKIINCDETPTKVLSSEAEFEKCIHKAKIKTKTHFCDRPKITKDFFNRK